MKYKTMRELIQWKKQQTQTKLINATLDDFGSTEFTFWDYYNAKSSYFDNWLMLRYGDRKIFIGDNQTPLSDLYDAWNIYAESILNAKAWEYQKIWDAWSADYAPLDNYDKSSTITTETEEHTDEQDIGTRHDEIDTPEITVTNSGGTQTSTESESPYDAQTDVYSGATKNTTVIPQTTAKTSQNTIETDTGAQHNENTYGATKTTITEKTRGNIGVTSSQMMLTQELEVRRNNFIIEILHDIINNTTIY